MTTATLEGRDVKERPILFSGEIVKAILAGRKTQTRRVIKRQPEFDGADWWWVHKNGAKSRNTFKSLLAAQSVECPYGQRDDRLWVRETWAPVQPLAGGKREYEGARLVEINGYPLEVWYRADGELGPLSYCGSDGPRWKPSIHMPRAASRLSLEITGVRVQRLKDISEDDAIAEGVERDGDGWRCYGNCAVHATRHDKRTSATASFMSLWDAINAAKYPSGSNPWIWAISFKRVEVASATA